MMKRMISAAVALLLVCLPLAAQDEQYWGKKEAYLMRQASEMLDMVDRTLDCNPPLAGDSDARKAALYTFDAVVHDTTFDLSGPFNSFVESRMNKVVAELDTPVIGRKMEILKLYDEGMIARTKSAVVCFDFSRSYCNGVPVLPDSLVVEIARRCDCLLLTHNHSDHVDPFVAKVFTDLGKPVIATEEILAGNPAVTHIYPSGEYQDAMLPARNGKSLSIRIYPGHQDHLQNNIYFVRFPEGKVAGHVGDQFLEEDMDMLSHIRNTAPRADLMLVNCWAMHMQEMLEGLNPKLVMPAHENEMGHTIDHREAFWLTYRRMSGTSGYPYCVVGWFEWFTLR